MSERAPGGQPAPRPPLASPGSGLAGNEHARSLAECLLREAERSPGRLAVVDAETELTVGELAAESAEWQRRMSHEGIGRGSVVAVQLPNWWEAIAVSFAAWGLGATVNLLTPIYRGRDLRVLFEMQPPDAVVVPGAYRGIDYPVMVREALAGVGVRAAIFPVRAEGQAGRSAAERGFHVEHVSPDEACMLMYTSGTTGRPKGVLHTSRTLLVEAESIASLFGVRGGAVFMASPLTHVTGLLYGVLMPLISGSSVVLLDRWDAGAARSAIEEHACVMTVAATPFLRGLTEAYREAGERCALRTFVCGGADIPPSLIEEAERVLGTRISRTYGSTEFPTLCAVRPSVTGPSRTSTEGTLIGEAEARLRGGARAGVGELEVRGPEMFVGYLDPADTRDVMTADGWFRTGDLARISASGEISIVGRVKDLIIRGGENISAKEVEDLVIQLSMVQDVAVVGFPEEILGERACAVVVSDDPGLTLSAIADELSAAGVAMQKIPEALLLVDELPRTASGKVQKFELRARVKEALAGGRIELRGGMSFPSQAAGANDAGDEEESDPPTGSGGGE